MELKSAISNHSATLDEILARAADVIKCGERLATTIIGNTVIAQFKLGNNVYIITTVGGVIVSLELKDVYCFRTQL